MSPERTSASTSIGRVLGAVDPLVGEAALARDLEVVDLLQLGLDRVAAVVRADLVVLVRRVRGPVAAGREHLAHQQLLGVEGARQAVVVDLAGAVPGAAQLDGHVLLAPVPSRVTSPLGTGGGQREQTSLRAADQGFRLAREIREVGGRGEHACPTGEFEGPAVRGDGAGARQRQDQELGIPGGQGVRLARPQGQDPEAGVSPARRLGRDHEVVRAVGRSPFGEVVLARVAHSRLTARSTAPATSPPAG